MELRINTPSAYSITIQTHGLERIGQWVSGQWEKQRICLITDQTVASLYGKTVEEQLKQEGFIVTTYVFSPGEQSKSLSQAQLIYDRLTEEGFTRSDGIIALGGGVVGDLAGFVAATYMRGIHYLQVPTTLLAQVDSSIGGKTAVNTLKAKNIVGAFWQPEGVLIDPFTLRTLEKRRVSEGMAEIIKYAAIADRELWARLQALPGLTAFYEEAETIILSCLTIKKCVVEKDPFDNGQRLILNFGHTIGHAVEKTAGYGVITHGEAVAIGMIQINQIAEQKGLSPSGSTRSLEELILKFGLPTSTDPWEEEKLYEALTHDKKTRGDQLKLILLDKIGEAKIETIPLIEMKDYLRRGVVTDALFDRGRITRA